MALNNKESSRVIGCGDAEASNLLHQLGRLPDEVVMLIFHMLPVQTLLLLEGSEDWVKRLALSVKIGNFTSCYFIKLEDIRNFIKPRCRCIRELYFDNLVTGSSKHLSLTISLCHELKVLSLKNCGVSVQHLYHILQQTSLEELSYTVINPSSNNPVRLVQSDNQFNLKQLKKISLEAGDLATFHCFIRFMLPLCHDLTSIRLDISDLYNYRDFLQTMLVTGLFNDREVTPDLPYLSSLVITCPLMKTLVEEDMKKWREQSLIPILQWILHTQTGENNWQSFWFSDGFDTGNIFHACKVKPEKLSSASNLLVVDSQKSEHCMNILENCKPNSVYRLGVYVPKLSRSFVHLVQRAGGKYLKQFSAIPSWRDNILLEIHPFYELLKGCANITDLDISGIHVTDHHGTSLCSAIAILKDLHRLCLPVCAITDVPVHVSPTFLKDESSMFAPPTARKRTCKHTALNQHASEIFERMVESCKSVEEFHLAGCYRCGQTDAGSVFCENIIASMYKWRYLKHIRLDHVPSLRLFTFLQVVAENCDYFTSLHLTNVGHPQVFNFMSTVISVLKSAKNLAFLRIVHYMFDLSDEKFWEAVSSAKNLQGLCIASVHSDFIKAKLICSAVAQLEYFHVFHLYCKSTFQKSSFFNQMMSLMGRKTGRGTDVRNVNFMLESVSYDLTSCLVKEPHCHLHHCGIRESSVKGPHNL